ncbi:hypothetical protein TDB9533_03011 [Thalassocella blandensis]|nr:hypothetical protein TDB9533_03011 [Thalassocella blandensis]
MDNQFHFLNQWTYLSDKEARNNSGISCFFYYNVLPITFCEILLFKSKIKPFPNKEKKQTYTPFLLLLMVLASTGEVNSQTSTNELETFQYGFPPPFEGLTPGIELTNDCVTFKNYAVKMTYIDIDYQFEIFRNKSCNEKSRTYKGTLPAEAMLAGEWNKLIVIDNGTGTDSRSLILVAPESGNIVQTIEYAIEPTFSKDSIEYYASTDKEATLEECPNQKEEINEWKSFGLGIGLARKEVFTLSTGKISLSDEYFCFGVQ